MCRIFSSIPVEDYEFQSRSIRIQGHVTSIRLEAMFWRILEECAQAQDLTLPQFLSSLHAEVLGVHADVSNFTSLLRCGCIVYLQHIKDDPQAWKQLKREDTANNLLSTAKA